MRNVKPFLALSITLIAFLGASCTHYPRGHVPDGPEPRKNKEAIGRTIAAGSTDILFDRVTARVPGFSGLFFDERQTLIVKIQARELPKTDQAYVRATLVELGVIDGLRSGDTRVQLVQSNTPYDWLELRSFTSSIMDVIRIAGVTMIDTDEKHGVVSIGVSDEKAAKSVSSRVALAGLPSGSWQIIYAEPRVPMVGLTYEIRPLLGGLQIRLDGGLYKFCTLGFVAQRSWISGFVTNSHCTASQGGEEQTRYFQNGIFPFGFDYIAHEAIDPRWESKFPGCESGFRCRSSDSAFAVADTAYGSLGQIARPVSLCTTTGVCNRDMASSTSSIDLTGTAATPILGQFLSKVGRTTGWTGGVVTKACVFVRQAHSDFALPCQFEVAAAVGGGDSGSAVLAGPLPGSDAFSTVTATLAGLLWGGDEAGTVFTFSPIAAVFEELGSLAILPFSPPPSTSGKQTQPSAHQLECIADRAFCLANVGKPGFPTTKECAQTYAQCLQE